MSGKTGVLTTYPPNLNTPPTFRKSVDVPGAGKCALRAVVGHHPGSGWTLVVRIDNKEALAQPVTPETSTGGWLEVNFDLSAYSGKTVLIELADQPGGRGVELAYWAELTVKTD